MALHAKRESHKAKTDFLYEAVQVTGKEAGAMKGVIEKRKARLNTAGARMAKLKSRRGKLSASTATCCIELPKDQNNLGAALCKMKVCLALPVAMTKELGTVTTISGIWKK